MRCLLILCLALGCTAARAAGPHGLQPGWVVDDAAPNNTVLFTDAVAERIAEAGAGWIRVNFRLARHASWDAAIIARYDVVVNTARAHGMQIVGLVGNEAWNGSQADWQQNARETGGSPEADGSNAYLTALSEAAVLLMRHFEGRINHWELWNEPNAWTTSYGVGGSFIYPSNFAYYLGKTYSLAREHGLSPGVTIITGGIFAHDIGGRDRAHATADDYVPATFTAGRRLGEHLPERPAWNWSTVRDRYGTYPADAFGYHIYLDDNAAAGPTDTVSIGRYLDWFRASYRLPSADGAYSNKPVFITELGFHTPDSAVPAERAATLQNQALSVERTMRQVLERPWVRSLILFQEMDNPFAGLLYGVYETDGSPKPARDTMRAWMTFEGRHPDRAVHAGIAAYYSDRGQARMGNPVDRGRGAYVTAFVDGAADQDYDGGTLGGLKVVSGPLGTFRVAGAFREAYAQPGAVMALGAPSEESGAWNGGARQRFRRGFLFDSGGEVSRHIYGDTNGDGVIGFADAAGALRLIAGLDGGDALSTARADAHPAPHAAPGQGGSVEITDVVWIVARASGEAGEWP